MSEKRRDSKNRVLRTGESQRKDGRYLYKYVDADGKPQSVYSWKLVATDKVPAGKRDCIALRDKEREIQKNLADGISTANGKLTVKELFDKYLALHSNVKWSDTLKPHTQGDIIKHRKGAADGTKIHGRI